MRRLIIAFTLMVGLVPTVSADDASAVRTLAEHGDAKAQFALGTMHRYGQGVRQDFAEALRWWRRAAEQGVVDAQYALGNIHSGGTGIAQDTIKAYMWYSIAAQTGDDWLAEIARANRDVLATGMTHAEIAEAERLAAEWTTAPGQ